MQSKSGLYKAGAVLAALLLAFIASPPASGHGLSVAVSEADNRQPAIPRADQDATAEALIEQFVQKTGKRPNIL